VNLVLIGMPASGKSTVGVLAAKALGLDFVDTDLLFQKQEGLKLHEILARDGAPGFLAGEDRLLSRLAVIDTIVSTGGSAVYHEAGMTNLKRLGRVVWLQVPYEEIERRLGDIATRGVVLAPGQTLRNLYDERQALYARWADLRLDGGREDLEVTVGRLVSLAGPNVTPGP
jgi:shikimate kinase